jgi:hypothetical protein
MPGVCRASRHVALQTPGLMAVAGSLDKHYGSQQSVGARHVAIATASRVIGGTASRALGEVVSLQLA